MTHSNLSSLQVIASFICAILALGHAQVNQQTNLEGEWVIISNVNQLGRHRLFITQNGGNAVFIHKGQSGSYQPDCELGGNRDHLLTGQLQGTNLTGTIVLCSDPDQKQIIDDCHLPSLNSQGSVWQTTFKATAASYFAPSVGDPAVAPDTNDFIDGTWLSEGWSGGMEGGHHINCHRDKNDDRDVPFKLERACYFSGLDWVNRYPESKSTDKLEQPFRDNVNKFIAALQAAGANVRINTTYRPIERAYLMHYAWQISDMYFDQGTWHAKQSINPSTVVVPPGIPICWVHRKANAEFDLAASKAAARAMIGPNGYGEVPPGAAFDPHTDLTSPN